MAVMQVEFINPFIEALGTTFEMMLGCEAKRSSLGLKDGEFASHEVNGIIGLSGKATGSVVVSMPKEVALKVASTMLMVEITELDDDVRDAIGEIANMVAGSAKSKLEEFELSVSLPNVVTGDNIEVHFPTDTQPITIGFETPWGPLSLDVGFTPND